MIRSVFLILSVTFALLGSLASSAGAEDLLEFMTGARVKGVVTAIRKTEKEFDFRAALGGRTVSRTYAFSQVHAVTMKGKRFVLTEKLETPSVAGTPTAEPETKRSDEATRSNADVLAAIEQAGHVPPDWFESAKIVHPPTLDLSWPLKPPTKGWNGRKNVGQFLWDTINPNTGRWHGGIKLVYQIMDSHDDEPELLARDQKTLGKMYFELLQDYGRAAYWLKQGKADMSTEHGAMLAECYWRLGSRPMAMQMLNTKNFASPTKVIKLLGHLGETARAIEVTEKMANSSLSNQAFIAAGDALREAGQLDNAIKFYERALEGKNYRNKDYQNRFMSLARESIETIRLYDAVDVSSIDDGVYTGTSTGYSGKLKVTVRVMGGRLTSAKVTSHREKQFYSALTDTEAKLIERQTVQGIDGTSGATITSQAMVNATAKALANQ